MDVSQLASRLARHPRLELACLPTPVHPLRRLSAELGGPEIWIKRDDLTGLAGGGNKTRKLEFVVADAVEAGADTLVTVGAVQSNHTRQTAAAAAFVLPPAGTEPDCRRGECLSPYLYRFPVRSGSDR